jgi:hypothetical protein
MSHAWAKRGSSSRMSVYSLLSSSAFGM